MVEIQRNAYAAYNVITWVLWQGFQKEVLIVCVMSMG